MGDFTSRLLRGGEDRFTARLLGRGTSSHRRRTSLPGLEQRVGQLEQSAHDLGASTIPQDKPGIFTRIVDVLSRPEYAISGATEELLNGEGVTSALARMMKEAFSGVGSIKGEKIDFTQLLERQGVGTKTLADAFPLLDGTWVGSLGSRGAAGLSLSILADPLTYITFGSVTKAALKGGRTLHLTKKGAAKLDEFRAGFQGRIDDLLKQRDDFGIADFTRKANELDDEITEAFTKRVDAGEWADDDIIGVGGARFAGAHIPGTEHIAPNVRKIVESLPGGHRVLRGSGEFAEGLQRHINRIFHPHGEFANLPKSMHARAIKMKRDFTTSRTVQAQRIHLVMRKGWKDADGRQLIEENFLKRARKELDADEKFGERLADVIEETGDVRMSDLTPAQQQVTKELTRLYGVMGRTLVDAGILGPKDLRKGTYIYHMYKNSDEIARVHAHLGVRHADSELRASFQKERVMPTLRESVEKSKEIRRDAARQVKAGNIVDEYPLLDPEYDFLTTLDRYVDRYSDSLARKAWQEQAVEEFGTVLSKTDHTLLYDLGRKIPESELAANDAKHLKQLDELIKGKGRVTKHGRNDSAFELLSDQGKREFVRRAIIASKTSEDFAGVVKGLSKQDDLMEFFPGKSVISDGEVEATLAKMFPEDADYATYSGLHTDGPVKLPEILGRELQNMNSGLINSSDNATFKKLLNGFDKVNNLFKLGVYTVWPASAFRDMYSNVALSMLDIGMGAMNPKSHLDTIGLMAGRAGVLETVGKVRYQWSDLRKMAKDFGVWVPGEVFAEQTGATFGGRVSKGLRKLTRARGQIENEARVQLWIQNIRRGVDPRQAADHVRDFLFDYGELSQVEREFFRRAIPFYTFTRKNIERQVKTLLTKPGLALNQVKPFRKRDDEREWMVKWEAESLGIRLNRDGKTVHMMQGIDLPIRNLDTLYAGGVGPTGRRLFGMLTPVLKVPVEVIAQRDFFTGGDLKRARGDTMGRIIEATGTPKPIRDWIGYKKEYDDAGRPKYTFDGTRYALLVRSWAFSRLFSTSDRQFREYLGDSNALESFVDVLTGIRVKSLNMDEQRKRKLGNRVRQIEDALARRGAMGQFTRSFERRNEVAEY